MNKKIFKIAVAVSTAIGVLALIASLIFSVLRHQLIEDNEALVHSIAQSILPALLVNDAAQVQALMKALESYPGIESAELISAEGAPIASYARVDELSDPTSSSFALASASVDPNTVHVMAPITFDSLIVANLHIAVNLWPTYLRIMTWMGVLLILPSFLYMLVKHYRVKLRFERVFLNDKGGPGLSSNKDFDIDHALSQAMIDADINIDFQPIKRMTDGGIYGMEVVVCWLHPSGQTLHFSPSSFVTQAEENQIFLPFDDWLLSAACSSASEWQHRFGPLVLTINITSEQLKDAKLAKKIRTICEKTQYPYQLLELEITESALSSSIEEGRFAIHSLAQAGLAVTLDSFGLMKDSMELLAELPVRKVKLDSKLVKRMSHDESVFRLLQTTIAFAISNNVQVMADGIETREQLDVLKSFGCSLGQGPYINAPLSASKFSEFLEAGTFAQRVESPTIQVKGFSVV